MEIKLETEADYLSAENVVREAFWNKYRPGCYEHFVVHNLRKADCYLPQFSFILEDKKEIIGTIYYSKGRIKKSDGTILEALTFGPVAVLPKQQNKGNGKLLINHSLKAVAHSGYPFVLITGDPKYYKKFGFVPASNYGIFYEGISPEDQAPFFMIKVFNENAMGNYQGEYSDPDCFNVTRKDVDKYDEIFTPKKKEKLPGQIFE